MTPAEARPEVVVKTPERLQTLYQKIRSSFAQSLATIDDAVNALQNGVLDNPRCSAAERAAHRLAGTAGTVGFPEATPVARRLETAFACRPRPKTATLLATEAAALRAILTGPIVATRLQPQQPAARVLAVHVPDGIATQIREIATALHLDVTKDSGAPNIEAAIIDLAEANGDELIRGYADRQPAAPIVALADTDSISDHLTAARAGASLVLPRTRSLAEVVATAQALARQPRHGQFRVLAVDDDPVLLSALTGLLSTEPIDVTTLPDPREFWPVLERTGPDLVVLDMDMPHVDGVTLCRMIRTEPRWSTLPVLFLTARTDPGALDAAFAAGADDYVSKPLVPSEVRARIRNRLERVALYRRLADTDPLTGLVNRRRLEADFDRLSALARRHGQPMSLLLLDIDHFKRVNDTHGHAVGDLVLRWLADHLTKEFRGEDVVARWGGEEIAVLTFGMSGPVATQRLTNILESIRGNRVVLPEQPSLPLRMTFSAGVAEVGRDGETLRALTHAADEALYCAKRSGRARVVNADDLGGTDSVAPKASETDIPQSVEGTIQSYYATLVERERLDTGHGRLERVRTQELLTDSLPPAPARVIDVGGGIGVYAQWLAEAGYDVHMVDVVPEHVSEALANGASFTATVGDARHLRESDDSADAVLMLGPLYHLFNREDRLQALREAHRVLRPGGALAAAVISRHAALLAYASRGELDFGLRDLALDTLHHGRHDPLLGFTSAYFHTADEAISEFREAGFRGVRARAIEGPMWTVLKTCSDPARLDALTESALICARALEEDPAMIAASAHLLITGLP